MTLNHPSIFCALFSFIPGAIALGIGIYLAPFWKNTNARLLICLVASISIWSLGYGMEFLSPVLDVKLWWIQFEYLGAAWLAPVLLCFILSITADRGFSIKRCGFLMIMPAVTVILAITNPHHHLMWRSAGINTEGLLSVMVYTRGPGFWIFVAYSYTLLLIATVWLAGKRLQAHGMVKKQLNIIFIGIAFPWIANVIYLFGSESVRQIDFTPFAFTLSGGAFFWGLLRYQMLNIIPLAHETLINSMGDPVIALDTENRILDMNKAALDLCETDSIKPGYEPISAFFPDLSTAISSHGSLTASEFDIQFETGPGSGFWTVRLFPLRSRQGKRLGRLLILKNITDKKQAEAAVKRGEGFQRLILEASPNPIVHYNHMGEVTYLNPAFTRVFGWTQAELYGKRIDFVPKENKEETQSALQRTIDNPEGNYGFITRRQTKSGRVIDVSINSAMYRPADGTPPSMVVNFADITVLKRTERELRKARDYITSIINSLSSILIALDENGRVTHWNTRAQILTGIPPETALGKSLREAFPQLAFLSGTAQAVLNEKTIKKESKRNLVIGGKSLTVDVAFFPIVSDSSSGVVILVDDITERVRIEEMMIQSEKMMSVGGLAAGMAHEINNPLAGIIQNVQVMKSRLTRKMPANTEVARACGIELDQVSEYMEKRNIFNMMDQIVRSGLRAANIVENMLSFSRKSDRRKSTHYLHDILESTIDLVSSDYNLKKRYDFRSIDIVREYEENIPPVICEKSEIQQVLLNLIKNGAEAMAHAGTENPALTLRCYKKSDAAVALDVADNGPGMDQETRKRIFEPFFTTKEVGIGTGLGLSVSYFIITENHNGIMTVDSSPGRGCCFTIELPLR